MAPLNQLSLFTDSDQRAWVVRESARARRLVVRVHRTGRVEVVVPRRTSHAAVERFIAAHRDWIETRRRAALEAQPPVQPFPPEVIELSACGEHWRLHLVGGAGRLRITTYDRLLLVSGKCADPAALAALLRRWLVARAQEVLETLLAAVAGEFGFSYQRLAIRRQRTRWGSCSSRGVISLNVCLLFQPPAVARYLLVHELSHTRHMNHSPRFWECVTACCPDWHALDRQLLQGWRRVPSWVFSDPRVLEPRPGYAQGADPATMSQRDDQGDDG